MEQITMINEGLDAIALKLQHPEVENSLSRRNPLPLAIGAGEGITIYISNPNKMFNSTVFNFRKSSYALLVQSVVYLDYQFV